MSSGVLPYEVLARLAMLCTFRRLSAGAPPFTWITTSGAPLALVVADARLGDASAPLEPEAAPLLGVVGAGELPRALPALDLVPRSPEVACAGRTLALPRALIAACGQRHGERWWARRGEPRGL
jgi:hypothetical protein